MLPLLLVACDPAPEADDPVAAVAEAGPWGVGHVEHAVETVGPAGATRHLRTSVWYPTEDTEGTPAAYWYGVITSDTAWEGAAPAAGPFPAVVYSHGHMGFAEASSFLAEHFASHGYVVVAPDHEGNTTLDDPERDTEVYLARGGDLTATLDALAAGALVDTAWDGDAVVVGHSFGGYTGYGVAGAPFDLEALDAACQTETTGVCASWSADWRGRFGEGVADPRARALVAMAPGDFWMYGAAGVAEVGAPVLLMTGEHDSERDADGADYAAALADHGGRWLDVRGGAHNTFIDLAGNLDDGQTLDPATGHRIVRAYALALAETALGRGDHTALLDGTLEVDPAGVVQ